MVLQDFARITFEPLPRKVSARPLLQPSRREPALAHVARFSGDPVSRPRSHRSTRGGIYG
jgi:hypothetical protein